jgi:hypothetical protein
MSKTTKAATLSTEVQPAPALTAAPAPAPEMTPASVTLMPPTLRLFGPTLTTLSEMVVHSRLGYVLDTDAPVDQFAEAGMLSLFMRLGTPSDSIVKIAQDTVEAAAAQQRLQFARDVKEAARQIIEEDAKAKKAEEVAAQIAATQAQIRALQASLTA